jgi:hypothetical protein
MSENAVEVSLFGQKILHILLLDRISTYSLMDFYFAFSTRVKKLPEFEDANNHIRLLAKL